MGRVKFLGLAALGLVVAVGGGWLTFVLQEFPGPFLSLTGIKCVGVVMLIEAAVGVVMLSEIDKLHLRASANPHSPLSRTLLDQSGRPPEAPPIRDAWSGGFENAKDAADKMSKGR
jgi:hypothetical protein